MKTTIALFAIAGMAASAQASVLADWAAAPNGTSIAAMGVAAGLTADDLTRGPGLNQAGGATFNSNSWDDGADAASALANGNYLSWGINGLVAGEISDMEIRIDVSGTGPDFYEIFASTDGFSTSNSIFFFDTAGNTQGVDHNILTPSLSNITGGVEFRLVGWGATSPNGTMDIETIDFANGGTYGIRLNGNPIPTPASAALLGLGGLAAARRRR